MKVWSNYCKEMKIASSGFYFYLEFISAFIVLAALLLFVSKEPSPSLKEVIFMDMSNEHYHNIMNEEISEGRSIRAEKDVTLRLKPATITYYDEKTGEKVIKKYTDKKEVTLDTYYNIDSETKKQTSIVYVANNFDDMLRITYSKRYNGKSMWYGKDGLLHFNTFLFGSETNRYKNLLVSSFGKVETDKLRDQLSQQKVRFLENREVLDNQQKFIPIIVVLLNGLMGIMILVAYISMDKAEGLIKAISVTPTKMSQYLLSKIFVVLTTALLSTFIVTIPIMKGQPNYLLFLLTAISLVILSNTIGIVLASWFKDLKEAFGVLMLFILVLMIPVVSHLVPSFAPGWIKLLPTYYMLEAIKETLLIHNNVRFILQTNIGMLVMAFLLFAWATKRFRRNLNI